MDAKRTRLLSKAAKGKDGGRELFLGVDVGTSSARAGEFSVFFGVGECFAVFKCPGGFWESAVVGGAWCRNGRDLYRITSADDL